MGVGGSFHTFHETRPVAGGSADKEPSPASRRPGIQLTCSPRLCPFTHPSPVCAIVSKFRPPNASAWMHNGGRIHEVLPCRNMLPTLPAALSKCRGCRHVLYINSSVAFFFVFSL